MRNGNITNTQPISAVLTDVDGTLVTRDKLFDAPDTSSR